MVYSLKLFRTHACLLVLILFGLSSEVHATKSKWITASQDLVFTGSQIVNSNLEEDISGTEIASCQGCHRTFGSSAADALKPKEVTAGTLTLTPSPSRRYWWRWSLNGGSVSVLSDSSESVEISEESNELKYCIAVIDSTEPYPGKRSAECKTIQISCRTCAEPPPPIDAAPVVSINPPGPISLKLQANVLVAPPGIIELPGAPGLPETPQVPMLPGDIELVDSRPVPGLSANGRELIVEVQVVDEQPSDVSVIATATRLGVNGALSIEELLRVDNDSSLFVYHKLIGSTAGGVTFTVNATDSVGQFGQSSMSITVLPVTVIDNVDTPPVLSVVPMDGVSLSSIGDTALVTVSVSHPDLPGILFSLGKQGGDVATANLVETAADNSFATYRITANQVGSTEIWISVEDANVSISTAVIPVNVEIGIQTVNNPPSVSLMTGANSVNIDVGESIILPLSVSDEDSSSVRLEVVSNNTNLVLAELNSDNNLLITGKSVGSAVVGVTAIDNANNSSTELTIAVSVSNVNQAPIANNDSFVFTFQNSNQLLSVTDNDTDPEGLTLSVELNSTSTVLGGELSVVGNKVRYTPPANWSAIDSFTYNVIDNVGLSSNEGRVTVSASDADADGVFDNIDNCKSLSNSDQSDIDSDNIGDLCDFDPDGNGMAGESGNEFGSGRSLVELDCLTCHLTDVGNAPLFGDTAVWDSRLSDAGGIELLVDSVVNGKGLMRAFGNEYTTRELTEAVRYLAGLEAAPDVAGGGINTDTDTDTDIDSDGIVDRLDNCVVVMNAGQFDDDNNGVGNKCEPLADNDGDGYPYSLDDEDTNPNRLLSSTNVAQPDIFFSNDDMSLGRIAIAAAKAKNYSSAAIVLDENEFVIVANNLFPETNAVLDGTMQSATGVIDLTIFVEQGATSDIVIQQSSGLPLRPVLKHYALDTGVWRAHSTIANNISSAPIAGSNCPAVNSLNYQAGLIAGFRCVRLKLSDGDANDADSTLNSQISFTAQFGSVVLDDPTGEQSEPPVDVDVNLPKGGGGFIKIMLLFSFFVIFILRQRAGI